MNPKRIARLMQTMDLQAITPGPHTSKPCPGHKITDQGVQFTSGDFTSVLLDKEISISMDGRGRALDNVFIERLWWTVKYENIYPRNYENGKALYCGLDTYFQYYNTERKHSSLDKKTPSEIFFQQEVKV